MCCELQAPKGMTQIRAPTSMNSTKDVFHPSSAAHVDHTTGPSTASISGPSSSSIHSRSSATRPSKVMSKDGRVHGVPRQVCRYRGGSLALLRLASPRLDQILNSVQSGLRCADAPAKI